MTETIVSEHLLTRADTPFANQDGTAAPKAAVEKSNVNRPVYFYYGVTALQFSAIKGHLSLARILVEHGADMNAPPAKKDVAQLLRGQQNMADLIWSSFPYKWVTN